jgi:hypothetical protein
MTKIYHFNFFILFTSDVVMIWQLRWIARMLRELIDADLFI